MFENLEEVVMHYEEVINELSEPDVLNNQTKYRKLMKEQTDLTPIVEKYKEYKEVKAGIEDSLLILKEEKDEEMRKLAKEELADCKSRVEGIEHDLKILMLPKDPNDDKNVIVEIRGGAGGFSCASSWNLPCISSSFICSISASFSSDLPAFFFIIRR